MQILVKPLTPIAVGIAAILLTSSFALAQRTQKYTLSSAIPGERTVQVVVVAYKGRLYAQSTRNARPGEKVVDVPQFARDEIVSRFKYRVVNDHKAIVSCAGGLLKIDQTVRPWAVVVSKNEANPTEWNVSSPPPAADAILRQLFTPLSVELEGVTYFLQPSPEVAFTFRAGDKAHSFLQDLFPMILEKEESSKFYLGFRPQ